MRCRVCVVGGRGSVIVWLLFLGALLGATEACTSRNTVKSRERDAASSSGGGASLGSGGNAGSGSSAGGEGGLAGAAGEATSSSTTAVGGSGATGGTGGTDCLGEQECPGESCAALLQAGATESGLYWIDPEGAPAIQIYCDQETDGGGWGLVWKNHGGGIGAERSNKDVFEQTGVDYIVSHEDELISQKHQLAYDVYQGTPGIEWLKLATLWRFGDDGDEVVQRHAVRVSLPGNVTWASLFAQTSSETDFWCVDLGEQVTVHIDGDLIGRTSYVFRGVQSYGFANVAINTSELDRCGQGADNLLSPLPDQFLRVDGSTAYITLRHLLSYVHDEAGSRASRCMFACWDDDTEAEYYEGFTWAVRVPLRE